MACRAEKPDIDRTVQHFLAHSADEVKVGDSVKCRVCNKEFPSSKRHRLGPHTLSHTGELPFKCVSCQERFRCLDSVRKHAEKQHGSRDAGSVKSAALVLGGKEHRCAKCRQRFASASLLAAHKRSAHTGDAADGVQVRCYVCPAKLSTVAELEQHMLDKHASERPFACKLCPMRFKLRQGLKRHVETHKPNFKCSQCGERFEKAKTCMEHVVRVHSKARRVSN